MKGTVVHTGLGFYLTFALPIQIAAFAPVFFLANFHHLAKSLSKKYHVKCSFFKKTTKHQLEFILISSN
jgi:hypothetical protein